MALVTSFSPTPSHRCTLKAQGQCSGWGRPWGRGGPTCKSDLGALPKALLPQGMVGRAGESASPILCTSSKSGLRFERPASQAYEAGDRKLGSAGL